MYENLLNPNEFSSISGVSKQTLLFYEKKNVILMKNYKKPCYLKMKKDSDFTV